MAEESLAKIFQQVQANLKDPNAVKLSLARKREWVFTVKELLKALEPRKIIQVQAAVINFVFQLASQTTSGSLITGLTSLVRSMYQNGADFTKIVTEFFEPAIAVIQNARTPPEFRLVMIQMTGKVFKTLWTRCANPPAKELFEAYTKLNQKTTDKSVRAAAYKALKNVIKVNPSSLFQLQQDLIRHLIKQLKDERSNAVKAEVAACLVVFIRHTMNFSNMHNSFELLWQVCLKGFEETEDMTVHMNYVQACTALLNLRLQESQQQGDIKTGFKQYNVQLRESLAQGQSKKTKANASQVLDVPRSFGDMVSMFAAMLLRLVQNVSANSAAGDTSELTSAQEGVRKAVCQVLCRLAELNVAQLEATDVEIILNSLVLSIPTAKDEPDESEKQRLSCVWTVQRLVELMQTGQRMTLLKLCLQTLRQKQFLLKMETLQNLTALLPKNFRVSTMLNEAQHTALLQITNEVLHVTPSKVLYETFQSENEVMEAVTPYMQHTCPYSVRVVGIEVIQTLGSRASAWSQTLITSLLSQVTIANADIASLKPEAVYVPEVVKDKEARIQMIDQIRTVNCYALALAGVLQHTELSAIGVPVAISTASLNLAKGLIIGSLPLEAKTAQDKERFNLSNIDSVTNPRREAGWILVEGLLNLGAEWIASELSMLMKLFKTVLRKEICSIDPVRMAQGAYRETVLNEFMIKKRAISCLKAFLLAVNVSAEAQKNVCRQVSGMVCNAVTFFLNQGDRLEIDKLFHKQFGTNQIQAAKADLFACLLLLPQEAYQSKFVTLLHPIVEIIINEDGGPSKIPSIFRQLLSAEDSHIRPSVSQLQKGAKTGKKGSSEDKPKEEFMSTAVSIWGVADLSEYTRLVTDIRCKEYIDGRSLTPTSDALKCYPRQQLLNNAIELFGKIFLSDSLNNKNKNQLLKHFTINVQPSPTAAPDGNKKGPPPSTGLPYYRPDKTQKMIRIALTLLNLIKQANKQSETPRIGEEQFVMILAIVSSVELAGNDFLVRLASEIYVLLHAHKIMSQPEATLEQIILQLERDVGQPDSSPQVAASREVKLQKASAVLGLLFRHFDYDTLLEPFADRMGALITKILHEEAPKVRNFSQHYATVMALEGPCPDSFYQKVFLNCYQLSQLDQVASQKHMENLGRLFNTFAKTAPQIDSRSMAVKGDLFEVLLEHKIRSERADLVMVALEALKLDVLTVETWLAADKIKSKVFETALRLVCEQTLETRIKVKVTELLAALVYKGHLYELDAESKGSFTRMILDEINSQKSTVQINVADALSSNAQFEELINFSSEFNLAAAEEADSARPGWEGRVYKTCLQRLYLLVFKIGCLSDFKEVTSFCKSMLAYKHTTPFTIMERVLTDGAQAQPSLTGENYVFKRDMRDETRCFVMKVFQTYVDLFFSLDTARDQGVYKAEAGSLLNLGFATVSYDDEALKQIGLDLVLSVVDLLSQVSDKVQDDGDDDEDEFQTAESQFRRKVQEFCDSSLLLEQYEAQIFSIIRQNLKSGLPSSVLKRVYKLTLRYITLPICKDEHTIGKVRDLLLQGCTMDLASVYNSNLNVSESSLAQTHLQKLRLLCKLIIFSKHGRDILAGDRPADVVARKLDGRLPSKFGKEDQERLHAVFVAGSQQSVLISHLVGCLNDALIVSLGRRANMTKCKLITFGNCSPQSALGQTLAKSVRFALEALSILTSEQQVHPAYSLSPAESKTITLCLLQSLTRHDISGNFESEQIKTYTQRKLCDLKQAKVFVESNTSSVLKGSSYELSEFCDTLVSALQLGILEINLMVLSTLQCVVERKFFGVFNTLMEAQKLESIADILNGLLLQSLPTLTSQQSHPSLQELQDSRSRRETSATAQTSAVLAVAQTVIKYAIAHASTEPSLRTTAKRVLACTVGRLLSHIERLPQADAHEQEVKKAVVMFATTTITALTQELKSMALFESVLVPVLVSALVERQENFSPFAGALMFTTLATITDLNHKQLVGELRLAMTDGSHSFFSDRLTPQVQVMMSLMVREPLPGELGSTIVASILVGAYNELRQGQPDERALQLAFAFILQFFKNRADFDVRVRFMRPLFTLLFSAMQGSSLSAQSRNHAVEVLYQVFVTDQTAFRKFAEPDASGQSWLTQPEKDVISRVVQKYASLQQQAPPTAAAAAQTKQSATLGLRQPLASAGGSKIQLGRFGKK